MHSLVDQCFSLPDIAVIQMVGADGKGAFRHDWHTGKRLAGRIASLEYLLDDTTTVDSKATDLILRFFTRKLLEQKDYNQAPDPATGLSKAVLSAEHTGDLTTISLTHLDNRRVIPGICSVITLVGQRTGASRALLDEAWLKAQVNPGDFISAMHEHLGDGCPSELQIGAFALFDTTTQQYNFFREL